MNKYYWYRKENHLCVDCGERAAEGKTRCYRCLQIIAAKQRERYQTDPEYRERTREYKRQWEKDNPEKMAVYKARKSMYNRKYFYGEEV